MLISTIAGRLDIMTVENINNLRLNLLDLVIYWFFFVVLC